MGHGQDVHHRPDRPQDGRTVAAEISAVGGLMDLKARRLVADPREYFKELTTDPVLFGL